MRLNDFETMAMSRELTVINCESLDGNNSRRRGVDREWEVNAAILQSISQVNILANEHFYLTTHGYNHPVRGGLVLRKTQRDYEADATHFAYRCILTTNRPTRVTGANGVSIPNERSAGMEMLIDALAPIQLGVECMAATEVTIIGCFTTEPTNMTMLGSRWVRRGAHRIDFQGVEYAYGATHGVNKRGENYSLFDPREGVIGEIKFRVIEDATQASLIPLTEDAMDSARRFNPIEKEYDGWIPQIAISGEPDIASNQEEPQFEMYRLRDSTRTIKDVELSTKTKNRRTHFSVNATCLVNQKRYTIPAGEYFICPPSLEGMSGFDYDGWIRRLSAMMTIAKTSTRVGFMVNNSAESDVVQTVSANTKSLTTSSSDKGERVFGGKVNSNRLK
jgi:hypothetical protein